MKNIKYLFYAGMMFTSVAAHGLETIDAMAYIGGDKTTAQDTVITDIGILMVGGNWNINQTAYVTNYGTVNVNGRINVADGMTLHLDNKSDDFSVGGYATTGRVIQVVSGDDSLRSIGGNFDIDVLAGTTVSLTGLMNIGRDSGKITLNENVTLTYDGAPISPDILADIAVLSNLTIVMTETDIADGTLFLPNKIGTGAVLLSAPNLDSTYTIETYVENGNVYARVLRFAETEVIVPVSKMSEFINQLRGLDANDPLVRAMDAAAGPDEIASIVARSHRMTPSLMMDAVRAFDAFRIFGAPGGDYNTAAVSYIAGDDVGISTAHVGFDVDIGTSVNLAVTGHYGVLDYAGELDEYTADLFGGNLAMTYANDGFMSRVALGGTVAKFDVGAIYDDGDILRDPTGRSMYAMMDMGYRFEWNDGYFVMPSIGGVMNYTKVASVSDNNYAAFIASDIGLRSGNYNVKYDYALRLRADTGSEYGVGLRAGIWAPIDGIGGDASITYMHRDDAEYMEYLLSIRFVF